MDWSFSEDQNGIREHLKKLLGDLVTDEALKKLEKDGVYFHEQAWRQLAATEMLGLALPEEVGGADLGLLELCLLLHQVGRTVAPIPALPTLVSAALPIAKFGSEAQKQRLLPGVAKGETILSAAFESEGSMDPLRPAVTATPDGESWKLSGRFTNVGWASVAERILVGARTGDGSVGVFLVDPKAVGVSLAAQRGTHGEPLHLMTLDGVEVAGADVLGDPRAGSEILAFAVDRTVLGMCAIELGIAEQAMFMTASYATERRQFGVPIGTFQAVTQRIGDCYIDVEAMRVSLWQAAWKLSEGLAADKDLAIAKFWAAEGGHRVVAAAQHVHGGMGFDRDYPLHRYFLNSKNLEFALGGAMAQLTKLGDLLAVDFGG